MIHATRFLRRPVSCLLVLAALASCAPDPRSPEATLTPDVAPAYDYPIANPYAATVIGMPPEQKLDLSSLPEPVNRTLVVFPGREIPDGFWYEEGLRYGELLQDGPAPLVYVIAGTGGDHRAAKMRALAQMFHFAGFHVVLLPSPTHPNFIINASENYLSDRPTNAAEDIYRVMEMIDKRVRKQEPVTQRMLTGYSLGALNAAFTARLDEDRKRLNFQRVLLINPPYGLRSSIERVDQMLFVGMPGGIDDADHFIDRIMARLGSMSSSGDALDFENERLLLDAYEQYKLDDASLATTIGLSFRLSASSLVFTNDVMSRHGYLFPKDAEFSTNTDMDTIMAVALRTSFTDYYRQYYIPVAMAQSPGATPQSLEHEASLGYLDSYIRNNPKFGLITNTDDIILAPGEIDKLASLFGERARIFGNGGHLGNMTHPAVAHAIVHFLQQGGQP